MGLPTPWASAALALVGFLSFVVRAQTVDGRSPKLVVEPRRALVDEAVQGLSLRFYGSESSWSAGGEPLPFVAFALPPVLWRTVRFLLGFPVRRDGSPQADERASALGWAAMLRLFEAQLGAPRSRETGGEPGLDRSVQK